MKRFWKPLLSLSAPMLIIVAMLSFLQRQDSDRLQSLPAFLVGAGLIGSGALGRRLRRKKLLMAMRKIS